MAAVNLGPFSGYVNSHISGRQVVGLSTSGVPASSALPIADSAAAYLFAAANQDQISGVVSQLNTAFSATSDSIDSVSSSVSALTSDLAQANTNIAALTSDVSALTSDVSTNTSGLAALSSQVTSQGTQLDSTVITVGMLDTTVSQLATAVAANTTASGNNSGAISDLIDELNTVLPCIAMPGNMPVTFHWETTQTLDLFAPSSTVVTHAISLVTLSSFDGSGYVAGPPATINCPADEWVAIRFPTGTSGTYLEGGLAAGFTYALSNFFFQLPANGSYYRIRTFVGAPGAWHVISDDMTSSEMNIKVPRQSSQDVMVAISSEDGIAIDLSDTHSAFMLSAVSTPGSMGLVIPQ